MNARKVNSLEEVAELVNQEIKQCAENIKDILDNLTPKMQKDLLYEC